MENFRNTLSLLSYCITKCNIFSIFSPIFFFF